jgi:hypothetical protein
VVVRRAIQIPFPYLEFAGLGDPRVVGGKSQGRLTLRESQTTTQTVTEVAAWTSSDPAIATVDRGLVATLIDVERAGYGDGQNLMQAQASVTLDRYRESPQPQMASGFS